MSDVRELLARLNPANVKFDTGRGGVPELTNQDIAGALAFIPAGLGRELFIACHWPDGAALSRRRLDALFQNLALCEWRKRMNRHIDAKIDHGIAVSIRQWQGAETAEQRAEVRRTQGRIDQARSELWPESVPEMLPALLRTIIEEIGQPRNCEACEGRGHIMVGELVATCRSCTGSGRAVNSDGWRARKLGKDPANFRRDWRTCYQWLLERARDAESDAAAYMWQAVRRDAA